MAGLLPTTIIVGPRCGLGIGEHSQSRDESNGEKHLSHGQPPSISSSLAPNGLLELFKLMRNPHASHRTFLLSTVAVRVEFNLRRLPSGADYKASGHKNVRKFTDTTRSCTTCAGRLKRPHSSLNYS